MIDHQIDLPTAALTKARTDLMFDLKEDRLWGSIRRAAKKDEVLADMLEQVILYHLLTKKG